MGSSDYPFNSQNRLEGFAVGRYRRYPLTMMSFYWVLLYYLTNSKIETKRWPIEAKIITVGLPISLHAKDYIVSCSSNAHYLFTQ